VLSTANITMQFGPKPLFENISVKFGEGNRYGLIGANGCGKSTFMKILGGDLEPSGGNVALEPNVRLGKLRQDQFAYEDVRVLDVVMMGHTEMWAAMTERDAIYANPEATDDDYMHAAELEGKFAEYGGYAEARAARCCWASASRRSSTTARWPTSRRAGSCACCSRRRCSRSRTCCCSTNRPTTSTSTRSAGSSTRSTSTTRR
jgi:ATPase subunit of ABC transporter with duplicated ATPase domains